MHDGSVQFRTLSGADHATYQRTQLVRNPSSRSYARHAIAEQRWTDLDYRDAEAKPSQRRVRPLGLYFWGDAWTLAAWCELWQDFRNFRLDRIADVIVAPDRFPVESGKRLEDFLRQMRAD